VSFEIVIAAAARVNIHGTVMSDQTRPYRMTRRAELEEQTRRRITESTVALHEELGPARTSISAVAERAGVRRSTVYRHFPGEEALFGRTEGMYTSLLRDEPLVPIVHRLLGDFYGYLRAIQDILMAGRGLRGHAARRTRAAIAHALAFPTWHSLTREQGLADGDAAALMCVLVEGSTAARSG
jgi:AcrR family transcriptional regulator